MVSCFSFPFYQEETINGIPCFLCVLWVILGKTRINIQDFSIGRTNEMGLSISSVTAAPKAIGLVLEKTEFIIESINNTFASKFPYMWFQKCNFKFKITNTKRGIGFYGHWVVQRRKLMLDYGCWPLQLQHTWGQRLTGIVSSPKNYNFIYCLSIKLELALVAALTFTQIFMVYFRISGEC